MSKILGPILQFRGIELHTYKISALVVLDSNSPNPQLNATIGNGANINSSTKIADIPLQKPAFSAWRIDISAQMADTSYTCNFTIAGVSSSFVVPAFNASPRIAYVSCNGFSDPKLMKKVDRKYDRWEHMAKLHQEVPYNLLLLGGDQVYTDEMWKAIKPLEAWTDLSQSKRIKARWTNAMRDAVDTFFSSLYLTRWAQPEVHALLQSIPTIMMWDDHDIFDGWGSYPKDLHECPVYQGIFAIATNYFRIFQMQLGENEPHPASIPNQSAYSMGFRNIGNTTILALDLRLERKPEPEQIVSSSSWDAIYEWLDNDSDNGHLIVMSSIPVSYLDLNSVAKLLGILPGQQELEDDLLDHWRSVAHQQERLRLIHRLFSYSEQKRRRVTIVSGDVHVGAASVIESTRSTLAGNINVINQLVSTGVVHPAPPSLVRYLLESIGSKPENIDRGITATMQPIAGKGSYLMGMRNWLALEPDASGRFWANWHREGTSQVITKVIHPCDTPA